MASIFKPTKHGKKSRLWYYSFFDPARRKRVTRKGYTDKAATKELAERLEREAARRAEGLLPREDTGKPLEAAETAYLADLARLGRGSKHQREVKNALKRVRAATGWKALRDVRPAGFLAYLGKLKAAGRSARTLNAALSLYRSFLGWCVRPQQWLAENPLAGIKAAPNHRDEQPNRRRAFTPEELQKLLLSVPLNRARCYAIAAFSGFRRSTMAKLLRSMIDLSNPERPLWRLPARIIKNRRPAVLPICPDALQVLVTSINVAVLQPEEKLFKAIPEMPTFYRDLAMAGIQKKTDAGRLDFHALRYFFAVQMAKRLPIQKVKVLLCHQTLAMTADLYAALGLDDISEEVWNLPSILESA